MLPRTPHFEPDPQYSAYQFTSKVAKVTVRLQWPAMDGQGDGIA
jgi:hypothetical protein